MITQPDLFGEIAAAEEAPRHAGLTCLRDAVPEALEVVVHLNYWRPRDTRSPSANRDWAWCVCRAGLRFEPATAWWHGPHPAGEPRGWDRTPAQLLTWTELAALIGDDPRRAAVIGWHGSLTAPDRWRDWTRPFELYPHPAAWHPSYIDGDHSQAGWPQRITAWQAVIAILTDAIAAQSAMRDPAAARRMP